MKILMVSMPSLHFYRWTEQLQDAGHQIYWFNITDSGEFVQRMHWINQRYGWKLKWNYPGRIFVKTRFPKLYRWLQSWNENDTAKAFEKYLLEVQPDVVHSFAMQIACIPILSIMLKQKQVKWIFSSWGSDVFFYKELGINENEFKVAIKRVNCYFSDCFRDYNILKKLGFDGRFLGVFPGNGGIETIPFNHLKSKNQRKTIFIKAYDDLIGQGNNIIKALDEELICKLQSFQLVMVGTNQELENMIKDDKFEKLNILCFSKKEPISNEKVLEFLEDSILYISNSLSDGMPNMLLEAMSRGVFPIQSNPGNAIEEIIIDGKNGFLIHDPKSIQEIRELIHRFFNCIDSLADYQKYNYEIINERYNRFILKQKIQNAYEIA